MRPFLVLLGFVLGSSASICFALGASAVIFLILQGEYERLHGEIRPLLLSLSIFVGLTTVAAFSFYGELRQTAWRHGASVTLGIALAGVGWYYWPEQ